MLYLDTEFNGHGGKLISMALVSSTDDRHFYRVWEPPHDGDLHPWVRENVIPKLHASPTPDDENRLALRLYLEAHAGEPMFADWPADFAYLMNVMAGAEYEASFMVPVQMNLIASGDLKPQFPHNALSDAHELMRWHQATIGLNKRAEDHLRSARTLTRNAFRQHLVALSDLFEATNGDSSDSAQSSNRKAAIDRLPGIVGSLQAAEADAREARR